MLLNKLPEKDFAVLRGSLESGRQSPSSLGIVLVLFTILQPLVFFLVYWVGADKSNFPYINIIFSIHLVITILLIVFSTIYAVPFVYKKSQKIQYLIITLASQNLGGLCFYIMGLFIIGKEVYTTDPSILTFTLVTLLFGLLIFLITSIRFYRLLIKGAYRADSRKDKVRNRYETKSYLPTALIAGLAIVYIIQYFARTTYTFDINSLTLILIGPILFYAMLFVLPEQLVILYCKYRFESFNFNKNEELNPMGRKGA